MLDGVKKKDGSVLTSDLLLRAFFLGRVLTPDEAKIEARDIPAVEMTYGTGYVAAVLRLVGVSCAMWPVGGWWVCPWELRRAGEQRLHASLAGSPGTAMGPQGAGRGAEVHGMLPLPAPGKPD